MNKISIIGAGAWGTTLSILAAENGHSPTIWSYEEDVAKSINELRENKKYLNGFQLPQNIDATTDLKAAVSSDIIILSTPSQYLRKTLRNMSKFVKKEAIIISAVKGLEIETQKRMSVVIKEELPCGKIAVISGPNISKEIARGLPAATVAASTDVGMAKFVQKILNSSRFRVYTNTDIIGVELGGALKNIIAIAAGVADGLMLGNNAKSALMVRGITEIMRLGTAMGGKNETFSGLSGIGDLMTTCESPLSRNHQVGVEIAKGRRLNDIIMKMSDVAEGVPTSKAARELSRKLKVEMPITEEVYSVLYEGKDPFKAISSLMQRELKDE
ncbi:MAG: NAD(P)H-dependent glycerol-3-phosphate dehydrogenase [bacterium]